MIDAIILIGFFNQLYFYFVLSKREKHLLLTFNNKTFLCDYMSTIVIKNFVHYFLSEFLNGQENGKVITNKCLNLSKAFYQQNIVNRNPMQILCL